MNILLNALGIQDSGGITVLDKISSELEKSQHNNYIFICNNSTAVIKVLDKYKTRNNMTFHIVERKGYLYRFYFENLICNKIAKDHAIDLIYNLSGTKQFFTNIPQLVKIQNLSYFSKKLDDSYKSNSQLILWVRQIYLKRLILKFMLSKSKHIEIQSKHVKNYLLDFIDIREKSFYVKSDIEVSDGVFLRPKKYDFSKKINFLYIVGPHFELLNKNLLDFTNAMLELNKNRVDFEINITLTNEQLSNSEVWDVSLNSKTNFLGYISDQEKMKKLFCDNTILISTSIIETLGLHVIDGIKNGVITIVPDEEYANTVYGEKIFKYKLFNKDSLLDVIMSVMNYKGPYDEKFLSLQENLRQNEVTKFGSILDVFDEVINV